MSTHRYNLRPLSHRIATTAAEEEKMEEAASHLKTYLALIDSIRNSIQDKTAKKRQQRCAVDLYFAYTDAHTLTHYRVRTVVGHVRAYLTMMDLIRDSVLFPNVVRDQQILATTLFFTYIGTQKEFLRRNQGFRQVLYEKACEFSAKEPMMRPDADALISVIDACGGC